MKSTAWLRARPRTLVSAGIVTIAALTIGTLAVAYEGEPTTEVDLHDGGVWVTKQSSLLVGHYNNESRVLDGSLRTTAADYDVLQAGARVIVVDADGSAMSAVDPAKVVLSGTAEVQPGAEIALGSDTVSVLDAAGDLRTVQFAGVNGFSFEGNEPIAELGENATATVGTDGTVYAASAEGASLYAYAPIGDGTVAQTAERRLDGIQAEHALTITSLGRTPYVLDEETSVLYGGDGSQTTLPADAVLQRPSNGADALTVSTPTALLKVSPGGAIATVEAGGEGVAAVPVSVGGCSYGAWSGSGMFVRDCVDDADDVVQQIEGIDPAARLEFRVNRDVVVLNDVFGGAAWLASENMQRVDNWTDITPPEGTGDEEQETTEETVETALPERTDQNTPPIAVDDAFGVRPGRTTVLPVLFNDTDADGDVLVAEANNDPAFGEISQIQNGGALQIAVPEDASGTTSFAYTATDGRGGEASATVSLTVRDDDENSPPVQQRVTPVTVEAGGTASYNVLTEWIDPDGDDIFLKSVQVDGGDEADFTSDGQVTYRAIGAVQGRKDVPVVVSDGTDDGAGVLRIDVRPPGTTLPVTNADHVVTRVGQAVTVSPLANDTSAGREPLRLTRVDEVEGATIQPDFTEQTFTFTSDAVNTYYVDYLVSAGPNSVPGLVRVDVLPAADTSLPPVAVRDVALLPTGGDVLVNVLGNDTDPAGGILVVQSVTAEAGSGVNAAVLGHETVRITDQGSLSQQARVSYTISNGEQSASGEIVVIPIPAPDRLRPPVVNNDTAVVRAGDVVTIDVLANDSHPNGDTLHVAPDLVPPLIDEADGQVFVSEDKLRFRAGAEAKTVNATYEAVDSSGQRAGAYVTIQILPRQDDANAAPRPRDLTARTLSGSKVTIPVPLDGIDEDGDSVELIGIASSPGKGRIVETGSNTFVYEAFDTSVGSDSFTYRVRDRLGKEGTARIQVGIAPPEATNQAPYAVKDSVVMRPGRQVALSVLENDSDPDGDQFGFAADALEIPDVDGLDAEVSGEQIIITSPDVPMNTSIQYTIEDARGLTATAPVQITVEEDVPLQRPIARDDRVRAEDVDENGVAEVPVLDNDDDPDGTRAALGVTLGEGGENATLRANGTVSVQLTDQRQLITYFITDEDGLTAAAFIHVPSLNELPPSLITTEGLVVQSGETVELPLVEYVKASGGRDVVVTEAEKVTAAHADGASLVKDERTLVYTSAADYFGQDALTFEVTDGTGPDDPEGRKATLMIPITVTPPDNRPPTMIGAEMQVAQGEDAQTLDLRALATDPDPDDADALRFALVGSAPDGLTAGVDGSVLSVSADSDLAKGTTLPVRVSVTDGETEPVEAAITVTVTASSRPLATANDDVIDQADQGAPVSVPVLDNDVNPFPGEPLTVVGAFTETSGANAVVAGNSVQVTSRDDFVGTLVVRYRIADATGDPDREVEGHIRITVQGRPDAPGKPTVTSVESRTVVMSWSPPIDNGASITGYSVRSTSGGYAKECRSTTCTLDGLTNNVEYNFVVTATNRVGESDPSLPSETARPDQRPETPNPPNLAFGDRSLDVSWAVPRTEGSPVESYSLQISPAPPSGVAEKTGVTGTSITWDGLQNGISYQVRVRAHNRAPEPSSWSVWSQSMVPAGRPDAPAAPTTQRIDSVGARSQMQVNWAKPNDNGDAVAGYQLQVRRGGAVVNTIDVPAGQTSQAVTVDTSTTDYTFIVRAQNKAGWGDWSGASAPRRAFTPPGAPTGVSAAEGDNRVTVSWAAGPLNGANPGEVAYQYSVNNGGWRSDWVSGGNGGSGTIGNGQVNNNGTYSVRVRAVATADGSRYEGEPSGASNQVAPYGQIGNPSANATRDGNRVTLSWNSPARNGRDITTEIRVNGGGWQRVAAQGSNSQGDVGYSSTQTIEVRTSAAGSNTTSASASVRTPDAPPPPKPRAYLTKGSPVGGCVNGCYYFVINTENFPAGSYQVDCISNGRAFNDYKGPFRLEANGATQITCHLGADGNEAWATIRGWGDTEHTRW
ncbi:Ig-like domain-containing protein [Microbacterium sp. NM3R9]|uniref:Ig-like domain-containing protein n=1 Tax=Microbacterium thalli TaxID=3027921 RepID=UPI0023658129|nr:Ig-like domain-containing protein [Microbacterium thalli]MDN8547925.1 Ig-like domain-containing protein [Microbacterium thalli]